MHNFKNLEVWKKSMKLAVKIYEFVKTLDAQDQYIFASQIIRCAISIPSNIAEGSGKQSDKEYRNYLSISLASSFELETQLLILLKTHSTKSETIKSYLTELKEIQKMIYALRKNNAKPKIKKTTQDS
jgi:four helix bundle protein